MNKGILSKLSAETFSQMAADGNISDNFSKPLTNKFLNLGVIPFLAALMSLTTGMAYADDTRNGVMAVSAVVGAVSHGHRTNDLASGCVVKGTNGVQNGIMGAVGGLAGNQIGGGNGKKAWTIAGAIAGIAFSQASENERMRKECAEQITQYKQVNGIPMYATNNSSPQSPILYEGRTVTGRSFYVTMEDSPGIAGLAGKINGGADVNSDSIVKNAIETGAELLARAYLNLDKEAREYNQVASGKTTLAKLSRYSVEAYDVGSNSELNRANQAMLEKERKEFLMAYNDYSRRRSVFANVADNAVVDGFNISKYGQTLEYFVPPHSATVTYSGKLNNSYAVIPAVARPN